MILHNLKLRGAIALSCGLGLDEIEVNFDDLPNGLIGIIGPNTVGKTSLIDNMHPFRQLFFRGGSLPKHFQFEDSYRILEFSVKNIRYKSEILINSKMEDVSATLFLEDDSDFVPINDGKLTTYDIELEKIGLSKVVFQNFVMRSANKKRLSSMTTAERKSFFMPLINSKLYERILKFLKSDIEKYNGNLRDVISEINVLEKYIIKAKENNENIQEINEQENEELARNFVNLFFKYSATVSPKIQEVKEKIKQLEDDRDVIRKTLNKIHSSSIKNNPELLKELDCDVKECPALTLFNRLKTVKLSEPIEDTERKAKEFDEAITTAHRDISRDADFLEDYRFKTLIDKLQKKYCFIVPVEVFEDEKDIEEARKTLNLNYGKCLESFNSVKKETQNYKQEEEELVKVLVKKEEIENKIEKATILSSLFGNDGLPLDDLMSLGSTLSSIGTDIMKNVYGDAASISFTTVKKKSTGKGFTDCFDVIVSTPTNASPRDISTLSSSETTWIEEAILEACFNVYNNNFENVYLTAFLDEQEGSFSETGLLDFLNVKQIAHSVSGRTHTFLISQRPDVFRETSSGAIILTPGQQPKIEVY